ncbi:hypothetical protein PISMIDRAFT_87396 [Pisolithus microcarpus 441]|uniref:Large ribosomal subunit protein mL40 n=1 Tax=Pisolithus microcarpus 441 TaxID=765257 RepID=A0A0D0ADH2_9AGAM|nr:hypothetical protein PISMIDRAFT_87396 [Pisolithus microcarpus 441]
MRSLVASRSLLPLRIVKTAARYSTATDANATNAKREVIRRMLYPPNVRNRPSPTGSWRPDVGRALQRAIPSAQAHETIERAWKLYQRHLRKKRDAELERKFECMRKAMAELEDIDPTLFREANKTEDPRARSPAETEALKDAPSAERRAIESRMRGLFPRELKVPTDTPSKEGWQHEWRPFDRPLH